ncbi:MAG: flagellar protein FlaG [Lachnospiraceae bacterium]|nr:flagellar protein FlaG [Lachnospiraceae bacterium]
MGIERIGGASTMSYTTSTQKVSKPEIQVTDMGSAPVAAANDRVAPVTTDARGGYSQQQFGQEQQSGTVQKDKEVTTEQVKSAVDNINNQLRRTSCSFKYHEETNRISITVRDKDTDEVIREIPPEKALDMIAKAWELAGLMVDEKR